MKKHKTDSSLINILIRAHSVLKELPHVAHPHTSSWYAVAEISAGFLKTWTQSLDSVAKTVIRGKLETL